MALLVVATDVAAQDGVVVDQVRHCMAATRAPGSYGVFVNRPVPVVQADFGGTALGARAVNDCLQDVYNVQYSLAGFSSVEDGTRRSAGRVVSANGCPRRASVLHGGSRYCVE